jgi:hypothetical protein
MIPLAAHALKRLTDVWGKDPMRDMYIALCGLGWVWTALASLYLIWRSRHQKHAPTV